MAAAARARIPQLLVLLLLCRISLLAQDGANQDRANEIAPTKLKRARAARSRAIQRSTGSRSSKRLPWENCLWLAGRGFYSHRRRAEQTVHLDEEAEAQPISVIVAVQTGRRAEYELPRMAGLASMLDPVLSQPGSQAAVVTFDSGTTLAQDFTGNADKIESDAPPTPAGRQWRGNSRYCALFR